MMADLFRCCHRIIHTIVPIELDTLSLDLLQRHSHQKLDRSFSLSCASSSSLCETNATDLTSHQRGHIGERIGIKTPKRNIHMKTALIQNVLIGWRPTTKRENNQWIYIIVFSFLSYGRCWIVAVSLASSSLTSRSMSKPAFLRSLKMAFTFSISLSVSGSGDLYRSTTSEVW